MKKTLLFLAALLTGVSSWAQITALEGLKNASSYTIKCVNRGFLYYDANNSGYITSSSHTNLVDATPTGKENELFAFLAGEKTVDGEYYLYNKTASKFVTYKSGDVGLQLTNEPVHTWVVASVGSNMFTIKYPKTDQTYINITNWEAKYGCKVIATAPDDGNKMTIIEVNADEDFSLALNKIEIKEQTTLGYPKVDTDAYKNLMKASSAEEFNSAKETYDACTDIYMPESGKAYYIKAWWRTDGERGMTFVDNMFKPTKDTKGVAFVCQKVNDKYIFVADNGYYLAWEADGKTGFTKKSYDEGQKFTVEKANLTKTGGDVASDLALNELLGKFCLKANNNHYLMFGSHDNKYHNGEAGNKYYGHTNANTVFYTIEEVPAYKTNTFRMTAAEYATFYAPYATVLPEGYTAYIVTGSTKDYAVLQEIKTDIPANTGVIIAGAKADAVKMSLSTSNPASLEDNCLRGSVNDEWLDEAAYVLSNKEKGIGFYAAERNCGADGAEGNTHFKNNANRAYLPAPADGARFLSFDFGTETAIENIEGAENDANAVIYDLSGRRVQKAQKGLYIVNGAIVIK